MSSQYKQQICSNIEQAIQNSIQKNGNKKSEPEYIADLTIFLPQNLASALNQNGNNKSYHVTSCFIHQKPIVRFLGHIYASYKKPELGDLLLLYKEKSIDGSEKHNAILLQATKGSSTKPKKIKEKHQLTLYTKWPIFEYFRGKNTSKTNLDGATRFIYPPETHSGAQYLIIDEKTKPTSFFCAEPNTKIVATNSLAEVIFDLTHFQTGRVFELLSPNCHNCSGDFIQHCHHIHSDDYCYGWTRIINDLISLLKTASFTLNSSNYNRMNDPHNLYSLLYSNQSVSDLCDDKKGNDENKEIHIDYKKGMGIIFIECSDNEIGKEHRQEQS